MRGGGNGEYLNIGIRQLFAQPREVFLRARQIHLVRHHDGGAGDQIAVIGKFVPDGVVILKRIATLAAGNIQYVQKHPRALHMAQKGVPQTRALARALDQTGNIRQHEAGRILLDDAQIRLERGKMIICNLRLRRRDHGQNRGFAHVRKAHQTHVRDGFQLQRQFMNFALFAGLGELRRLAGGRGEMLVAKAAAPAAIQHLAHAGGVHIQQHLARFAIAHHGARGHLNHNILAALAALAVAHAVAAVFRGKPAVVAEIHQRVHAVGGFK